MPFYPYDVSVPSNLWMDDFSARVPAVWWRECFPEGREEDRKERLSISSLVKRYMDRMFYRLITDKDEDFLLKVKYLDEFDTGVPFPTVAYVAGYRYLKWLKESGEDKEKKGEIARHIIGEERYWDCKVKEENGQNERAERQHRGEEGESVENEEEIAERVRGEKRYWNSEDGNADGQAEGENREEQEGASQGKQEKNQNCREYNGLLQEVHKHINNQNPPIAPSGYYAVLMLDGDRMGAWFSATAEKLLKHARDEDIEKIIKNDKLKGLLNQYRESIFRGVVLGPAYLRNLSTAIATFAYLVPAIVMGYGGFMVYVGGDDVLAVLPPETVFHAISDIKLLFAGGGEEGLKIKVGDKEYMVRNGILYEGEWIPLGMLTGTANTMSGGVAIYWLKDPLMLAIDDAREGEGKAKSAGRDAVSFIMRERSGRPIEGVIKWQRRKAWGVATLKEITGKINDAFNEGLSARFFYEMMDFLAEIEALDEMCSKNTGEECEELKNYFAYFIQRHLGSGSDEIVEYLGNLLGRKGYWRDILAYMKVLLRISGRGRA